MKKMLAGASITGVVLVCLFGTMTQEERGPAFAGEPDVPEGVEVLTRGPVHEAFATPVGREPEAAAVLSAKPPEPVPELPPDLKPEGENVTWIPGYWAWDEDLDEYLWVSGIWRDVPPGHEWVPGYWHTVEGGYQWVSGYWSSLESPVVAVPEPPEPIEEAIPPPPDAESTFFPGCWVYVENRFFWRPGYFVRYRPGWVWTPACYHWTPAGYIFVDHHWDLDAHHRGCLFAPVRFVDVRRFHRPGVYFRPYHCVRPGFLMDSLFVRTGGFHRYYFGDYYEPRYARLGFTPWVDFRIGRRHHDPLFAYYRWNFSRERPRWETELRAAYVARSEGTLARPPRTLDQQIKLAKAGKEVPVAAVPVARLAEIEKTSVKITKVTKTEITHVTKRIEEIEEFRDVRRKVEAKVRAKASGKAEAVALDLPRSKVEIPKKSKGEKAPPPPPDVPKKLGKAFEGKIGERKDKDKDFKDMKDFKDKDSPKKDFKDPFKDKDFPPKKDIKDLKDFKDKDFPPKKDFKDLKDFKDPFKDKDFPPPKKDFKDLKDFKDPFKDKDFPPKKDFKDPFKDKDFPPKKDFKDPFKDKDFPKGKDKDLDDLPVRPKEVIPPKPPKTPKGRNKDDDEPKGKGKGKDSDSGAGLSTPYSRAYAWREMAARRPLLYARARAGA